MRRGTSGDLRKPNHIGGGETRTALRAYFDRRQAFSSVHTMSQRDSAQDHLVLTPPEWRAALRAQLVATGFEQDAAGVLARRVIEGLVRGYLAGSLDPPVTHSLDEAA